MYKTTLKEVKIRSRNRWGFPGDFLQKNTNKKGEGGTQLGAAVQI